MHVIIKDAIMTFIAATALLEGRSRCILLRATKHHKVRCLPGPQFTMPLQTYALLDKLLRNSSPGEALREAALDVTEVASYRQVKPDLPLWP